MTDARPRSEKVPRLGEPAGTFGGVPFVHGSGGGLLASPCLALFGRWIIGSTPIPEFVGYESAIGYAPGPSSGRHGRTFYGDKV